MTNRTPLCEQEKMLLSWISLILFGAQLVQTSYVDVFGDSMVQCSGAQIVATEQVAPEFLLSSVTPAHILIICR